MCFVVGKFVCKMIPRSSLCFLYCTVLVVVWVGLHSRIHVYCLNVQCVCWGWVICFDVSCVFAMSYSYWLPVWQTNELFRVFYFNLYMPLECILFNGIQSRSWLYMVVLVRKAIFKLVFLNKVYEWTLMCEGDPFFLLLCLCGCEFWLLCFKYYFVL
jgi:hypothetical protein